MAPIHLFIVLTVMLDGVAAQLLIHHGVPGLDGSAVHLAVFAHILLTVYDGTFSRARTLSWCTLVLIWLGATAAQFAAFIMPWNAGSAWTLTGRWTVIIALALAADLAMMRRQTPWRLAGLVGLALMAGLAIDLAAGFAATPAAEADPGGLLTPMTLLPPWDLLPVYAVIRSLPDKLGGLLLGAASLLAFLAVPWHGAGRLRTQRATHGVWALLCVALAAAWAGLGDVGAHRPEEPWLQLGRALAGFHLAMLLVVPFALRAARRGGG